MYRHNQWWAAVLKIRGRFGQNLNIEVRNFTRFIRGQFAPDLRTKNLYLVYFDTINTIRHATSGKEKMRLQAFTNACKSFIALSDQEFILEVGPAGRPGCCGLGGRIEEVDRSGQLKKEEVFSAL